MSTPEFETFLKQYPTLKKTESIDSLRASDYSRLDGGEHIYFDYTGVCIYAESQFKIHQPLLNETVFGNPDSSNTTSLAATQLVEGTREYILKFFNADPDEYLAIFTSNSSSGMNHWYSASASAYRPALTQLYSVTVSFGKAHTKPATQPSAPSASSSMAMVSTPQRI